jgi:hypothetical protein
LLRSVEIRFGALSALSDTIVTSAEITDQKFPFVTVPHFAGHVAKSLQYTNAIATYFISLVPNHLRSEWEQYSSISHPALWSFINETLRFQGTFKNYHGPKPDEYEWIIKDMLHDDFGDIPKNSTQPFFLTDFNSFPLVMKHYAPTNYGKLMLIITRGLSIF